MTQAHRDNRWHSHLDTTSLAVAVAAEVMRAADRAIADSGAFHLVLAGGSTPRRVYELLATLPADWAHWHIYFGDERCLPPDHDDRNSLMAAESWLENVDIPAGQIHPMPAELGADAAALSYARALDGVGMFDLVLLGLGEDGHTASLFPGQDWGEAADAPDVLAVFDAPKPPPERLSLSARRLSAARQVIFMVSGEGKRHAVTEWLKGEPIPAAAIRPEQGVEVHHDLMGI